jgi:hypothetical protein
VTRERDLTAVVALVTGVLTVMFLFSRYPFDRRSPSPIEALLVVGIGMLAAYGIWRFGRPARRWLYRLPRVRRESQPARHALVGKTSDELKRTFMGAQREALDLRHNYIGTEHLLLSLVAGDSEATRSILAGLGASAEEIEREVGELLTPGPEVVAGEIGLTRRAKLAIELASDESRRLGDPDIRDPHLLVGLALVGDGIASGVLRASGVTPPLLRAAMRTRRASPGGDRR